MDSVNALVARGAALLSTRDDSTSLSPAMLDLTIALMVFIFVTLVLGGALYIVRKVRIARAIQRQSLPQYNEPLNASTHRRLTITTTPFNGRTSSIYVYDEKSSTAQSPRSPPLSPDGVPEIRITFPDEQDDSGHHKSGRVVVVRVGEKGGIGLEPLREEQLPAYEKDTQERFHSIDMDRIGGLKEKESWS